MNSTPTDIVHAAMQLPPTQRAQVVQDLLDSLSPQAEELLDGVWATELEERLVEYLDGEADVVPWSQLKLQK